MEFQPPDRASAGRAAEPEAPATWVAGAVLMVLLCGVTLALAFRHGAYSPADWLLLSMGVAALAFVVSLTGPAPRVGRIHLVLLGVFGAQVVWTAASMLWASSPANAWEEINRTLLFGMSLVLAFVAVRWAGRRGLLMLAVAVCGTIAVVALAILLRLGTGDDVARFFAGGRLNYPVTYWNALAALLMMGFWLALGLANGIGRGGGRDRDRWGGDPDRWDGDHDRRLRARWPELLCLAVAVVLVELALLPQSRGALWAFFLVVPFFVILSPHRFRALTNLAVTLLPVVLFWNGINGVYVALRDGASLGDALARLLQVVGFSVLIVVGVSVVTWLLERIIGPPSRRLVRAVAVGLVVLAVLSTAGGLIYADQRTGGLGGYVQERWAEFTSDEGTSERVGSRFSEMSLNGRLAQWKVAGRAFGEHPLLGLGAQNYEAYYYQHRTSTLEVKQPHSQPMQLLSELGFPGALLWVAFVGVVLVRAGLLRFQASDRRTRAALAAMMTAVVSWFIHSSADWLWQLAAVSVPAMMLLGGLIAPDRQSPAPAMSNSTSERGSLRGGMLRALASVVALLIIGSAVFPYLSLRYTSMASAAGVRHLAVAADRTRTAESLDPSSAVPMATRAGLYQAAARQQEPGSRLQSEYFASATKAWLEATKTESDNWLYFYSLAGTYAAWSEAVRESEPGFGEDLAASARTYLAKAKSLNPLSPQVAALAAALENPVVDVDDPDAAD